jgi:uncharacterized membrane protein YkoI
MKGLRYILAAAPLMILGVGPWPASAGPLEDIFYPPDANGVVPIERVLNEARSSFPGTITEVELEQEHGRPIYEVEIAGPDHREIEVKYDARTGQELSREVKKKKPEKKD